MVGYPIIYKVFQHPGEGVGCEEIFPSIHYLPNGSDGNLWLDFQLMVVLGVVYNHFVNLEAAQSMWGLLGPFLYSFHHVAYPA